MSVPQYTYDRYFCYICIAYVAASPDHGSVLAQSKRSHVSHVTCNNDVIFFVEVQMWELTKIFIPRIKGHWEELAFCMRYSTREVEIFNREGKSLHKCCEKLFVNWLTTSHGPEPKTYETLLNHIKKIEDLVSESEAIEKELIKGKDKYIYMMFYNVAECTITFRV